MECRDGLWRILGLDCVYERDGISPVLPGRPVALTPDDLAPNRSSYAILTWHLARRGYAVSGDLMGDDQPERVAAFYAETLKWVHG
ncbi:hypothetical protein ABZ371_07355 [Streptomyces sp. NPDC005899]|uniref:hypothetical protein n=1 Tax=Streptomyces sp. NPDC005899 TaxID=3155716 RepID=UPI0033C54659